MSRLRRHGCITLLLLALSCVGTAQEGSLSLAGLQGIFSHAKDLYESPDQLACIPEFTRIIDALSSKPERSTEESFLLKKSLEYRARAYFNSGNDALCSADLRALVAIDPAYMIAREEVSPKFYAQFESLKGSLVGYFRATSTPPGATVYLDGQLFGTTDFGDQPVIAGAHKVRVARKGYEEAAEEITIVPRQSLTRSYTLNRTAASLNVRTIPAGVEVTIDGQPAGKTPPGEDGVSGALVIDGLGPGQHLLDFRLSCYESTSRILKIEAIQDYEVQPITLEPSTATLTVTASAPGEVFLDGMTSLGQLPVTDAKICSGQHTVEVLFAAGKYAQMIAPRKGEHVELTAVPRATLVFLGVAAEPSIESQAREREREVATALSGATTLNVIGMTWADGAQAIRRAGLNGNAFLTSDRSRSDEERRNFQEGLVRLCSSLRAEMVCLGRLTREGIQENLFLNFAAPPSPVIEPTFIKPMEEDMDGVVKMLNRPFSQRRPWIGCRTLDLVGRSGPVILSVFPEGPAAGRLAVGQEILEAAGKPVNSSAVLFSVIAASRPGQKLLLRVKDPKKDSAPRQIEIIVGESPVEINKDGPMLYTRIIADLAVALKTDPSGLPHFLLGLCFLKLNDFQSAYSEMQKAQLGGSWGICDGTVFFYKGRILAQLGYKKEAADAYRQALAFPQATLYDNDGRPVAEAAQRALRDLGL